MPHVITQSCCNDAACVSACPVNCIHPSPDEPEYATAEMLHVDPEACVDCGACVSACPVEAIKPEFKLTAEEQVYRQINAEYYREPVELRTRIGVSPIRRPMALVKTAPVVRHDREPLRVAIVGSGPAAMYAADELLTDPSVTVNVFDKLPVPYGLVRAGVAPDHQHTKAVARTYDAIAAQRGFAFHLGVEIGADLTHAELARHHHAVLYATGGSTDRRLEIPGAALPGVGSATDFVAWYNGHPDHLHDVFDLSGERAIIIGNGNVALDVARILTTDPDRLASTDIAPHALEALRHSTIREVVLVARRGWAQSAWTVPEFEGLLAHPGVELVVEPEEVELDSAARAALAAVDPPHVLSQKVRQLAALRARMSDGPATSRRIVLRFLHSPKAIVGDTQVRALTMSCNVLHVAGDGTVTAHPTDAEETITASLVLSSIGYRGVPVPGVPFDDAAGLIPNVEGRVLRAAGGPVLPGVYAAGWIKRGPTGYIGTNKADAENVVAHLVDDFNHDRLRTPPGSAAAFATLLRERVPARIDLRGWQAIDAEERFRGVVAGRVREKIVDPAELHRLSAAARPQPRRFLPWPFRGRADGAQVAEVTRYTS